jgi:hypothetical protein
VIRNSLFRTALSSEKYADLIGVCMALAGQFALSLDSPLKINGINGWIRIFGHRWGLI